MIQVQINSSHTIDANAVFLVENAAKFTEFSNHDSEDLEKLVEKFDDKTNSVLLSGLEGVKCYGLLKDDLEKNRKLGAHFYKAFKGKDQAVSLVSNTDEALLEAFLEGFILASYSFQEYMSEKKDTTVASLTIVSGLSEDRRKELYNTLEATLWTRDRVNEPVSHLNAPKLSEEIVRLFEGTAAKVEVFEKAKIESLKMGGLLAVNKGSIDPPTFSIIEYKPENAINEKPIVLVGKGVVYDTGGLSLKPTPNSMDLMKSDMGGAAMMIGALGAIVKNELPVYVIGLIPATDNRPGGNAYAPGDVITMYNGKTVEVLNTDAEGRMILADALSYGDKYDPMLVMDAATLTGAAIRSIGEYASCVMGNADEKYFKLLKEAGEKTWERTVELPFWEDYGEEMKSKIADLKNIGGPYAGQITAGKFLENFTESPYVHIDIAGPSFTQSPKGYYSYGGTGYGVRLIYNFMKNLINGKA